MFKKRQLANCLTLTNKQIVSILYYEQSIHVHFAVTVSKVDQQILGLHTYFYICLVIYTQTDVNVQELMFAYSLEVLASYF